MAIRPVEGLPRRPKPPPPPPKAPRLQARPVGRPSRASHKALIPAAARVPDRTLSFFEDDLSGEAIETFTLAVGGRQALIDALAIADVDGTTDRVVNTLLDPRYHGYKLRRICQLAGITIADLFAAYKKAAIAKAHIEAAHLIAHKLVPVVEDVMTRAAPVSLVCPACQADAARQPTCPTCRGTGAVRSEPDLDRQKLALELGQLTASRAGILVQQNQGVLTPGALSVHGGGALEQLHQAVGELLFAPTRRRAASPIGEPPIEVVPRQEPPDDESGPPSDEEPDDESDEELDDDDEADPADEPPAAHLQRRD